MNRKSLLFSAVLAAVLCLPFAASAEDAPAEEPVNEPDPIKWVVGPKKIDLGNNLAQLDLAAEYKFADANDTRRILKLTGNGVTGNEVGLIIPVKDEGQDAEGWALYIDWEGVGYIKDDDKDKIDAKELLDSLREGTEQTNEERKQLGLPGLHVTGWQEPPHYDQTTHHFVWSVLAKDDTGQETINYNVRILGREGFMSITVADDPKNLAKAKTTVEGLLSKIVYKPGKTYAEFRPGDKVAEYGLAGLVAVGGGVAAAKLGLFAVLGKVLAKAWKLVVLGIAGLGAGIKRLFGGGRRGPMSGGDAPPPPAP